jgi:hypothetical protein
MARFLFFTVLVLGLGFFLTNRLSTNPLGPVREGREVVVHARDLEVRFYPVGRFSDAYMLFGGSATEQQGYYANVVVSGLAERHASLIAQRHPDFHLCSSPGAASAKRLIEDLALIGADGAARRTLLRAVDLYQERLHEGGERTCISFSGERLALSSARVPKVGIEFTQEIEKGNSDVDFYLVKQVEIADCKSLIQ